MTIKPTKLVSYIQQGALVLTPNHRAAVQILEQYGDYLASCGQGEVCPSPAVNAIDVWIQNQWQAIQSRPASNTLPRLLTPVEELHLWSTVIEQHRHLAPLINTQGAARKAMETYRTMLLWQMPRDALDSWCLYSSREKLSDDTDLYRQWMDRYLELKQEHDICSQAESIGLLQSLIKKQQVSLPGQVVLSGFDEPPPLYQALFQALEQSIELIYHSKLPQEPEIIRLACHDQQSEIQAAVHWAREIIDANPQHDVIILCQDIFAHRATFERILRSNFNADELFSSSSQNNIWAISAGRSLASIPMIDHALKACGLFRTQIKTLEILELLRSPFFSASKQEKNRRNELEYRLRDRGEIFLNLDSLRFTAAQEEKSWYCPELANALHSISEILRSCAKKTMRPVNWCEHFEKILELMQWNTEHSNHHKEPVHKCWQTLLKDFASLNELCGSITLSRAHSLLSSMANERMLETYNHGSKVKVLSPLEAAGMEVSHCWFMGLSDQQFPGPSSPVSFLPRPLQNEYDFPDSSMDKVIQSAQKLLQRSIAATGRKIVLSFALQQEGSDCRPSNLLAKYPGSFHKLENSFTPLHPYTRQLFEARLATSIELFTEPPCAGEVQHTESRGTELISDQAKCPFKAFAINRLAARELPEISVGLDPRDTGTLVHHVLEVVWKQLQDTEKARQLSAAASKQLDAIILEAIDEALRKLAQYRPASLTAWFRDSERQRLFRLISRWLALELEGNDFSVIKTEHRTSLQLDSLLLNFKVDRVNRLPDGSCTILDYKTGKAPSINWEEDRPDHPQLMLYLEALQQDPEFKPVSALMFAYVNSRAPSIKGVAAETGLYDQLEVPGTSKNLTASNWESLKSSWHTRLEKLAREFVEGINPVMPKPKACQYCHLEALCRIHETAEHDDE